MNIQVTFGAGAPNTSQLIWASLPSRTVTFIGRLLKSGADTVKMKLKITKHPKLYIVAQSKSLWKQ